MSDIDPLSSGKADPLPPETPESLALAVREKRGRGRPPNKADAFWEMLTVEYITGTMTIAQLARKYGVLYATLRWRLTERLEVKARANDPGALAFLEAINVKSGALSEKAREAAALIVKMGSDVADAWQKEQVERCYSLRKEVDDLIAGTEESLRPSDLHRLAQTEELVDRTARRSLGLKDSVHVEGSIEHNHRHLIEAAKEVLGSRGADETPTLDADFELMDGGQ